MNPDEIVEQYESQGLVASHGSNEPGYIYEPHVHEKTYMHTISGSLQLRLDNGEWKTLVAGDECVINSDQLHEGVVGPDGWEYVVAWDAAEAAQYKD